MVNIDRIGKEMAKQDNRATQYPLFIVMEDVERPVPEELADGCHRKPDETDGMCEKCLKKYNDDELDMDDFCDECYESCFWWYKKEQEPNLTSGVWFTAKACAEHIRLNSYHYKNPVVYGIGAWRNFEMQTVMLRLLEESGEEIPSHYK